MTSSASGLRLLIKGLLRVAFRVYYRSIQVQGIERLPARGPVLLVANHPNSLLDPALLVNLLPRPVHFGAKHTLFTGLLRPVLEAFQAIPLVRAQDDRRAMGRNARAFERFKALLREGRVAAIFPEGLTQDDPHMAPVKGGAARIALQAEADADFNLRLTIVPVGLQFEPRRQFRGDAFVRFGEPFTIGDLARRYAEDPRQAARELTDRISAGIRRVAYHVDATDRIAFVERLVDIYFWRARRTGITGVRGRGVRGELKQKMAACLNHYAEADPEAVAEVERELRRYERLRDKAGLDRRLLEEPSHLLPGPLAPVQATAEALLGVLPALCGFLTGAVPYYATKRFARSASRREGNVATLSLNHVLAGAVAFPLFYGLEVAWVWREFSGVATITFALLLIPTGLFAWVWMRRMRKLAVNVGGRMAAWMKLDAVARVGEARNHLMQRMERMRERYRAEVLGWGPIPPRRAGVLRRLAAALALVTLIILVLFGYALRDRSVAGLPQTPSPWHAIRDGDPADVTDRLERDARGAAAAIAELDRLELQMRALRAAFSRGERSYYSQDDEDAIHRLLLTYLNLRTALLRTAWTYRGAHDEPAAGALDTRAFLLAYASAATLLEKAEVIVTTFADDTAAQRKLNEGDLGWDIPEGTYDRLRASLANATVVSELHTAMTRFDALRRSQTFGSEAPWRSLIETAAAARPAIERVAANVGDRKMQLAMSDLRSHAADPLYVAQGLVATWIGDYRLKTRPDHRGLISSQQVSDLRDILQPGDILLERRNWFMSNAFLPGFWPHATIYLGDAGALDALGVSDDPRVSRSWNAFIARDAAGHSHAVIEAVSEGVIFTSLEHSVGESDAVAVLRPRLTDAQRREAIARAFSHYGKPYDFEFDFFSTDRLVCTEVVYRAYDGMIEFPLTQVLGRLALPAITLVQIYADTRGRDGRPFDVVQFLDAEEDRGRAVVASEAVLLQTLHRSNFTFLQ